MCELALTKAQSEKRKVKSESAKRKRVLTPLHHVICHVYVVFLLEVDRQSLTSVVRSMSQFSGDKAFNVIVYNSLHLRYNRPHAGPRQLFLDFIRRSAPFNGSRGG